jgi:(p)ppGpp synthase/HD superfamily hydrolase
MLYDENVKNTELTRRFADALVYANEAHRIQRRKGSNVPYIGHLLGVTDLVLGAQGTEDEAIAALLHDTAEDQGGRTRLADIRNRFGSRVAEIVEALSDALPDEPGARKPPWHARKLDYQNHLRANVDRSVWLVSAADKLNNVRATVADLRAEGSGVWDRFSAQPPEQVWNYEQLLDIYQTSEDPRLRPIVDELARAVAELKDEAAKADRA